MTKPVDELTNLEVLRDLADTLQWPAWFDTDDGEKYAEQVRPRLIELADALEAFLAKPAQKSTA